MARILCRICAFGEFIAGRVAGQVVAVFRCPQGVPDAGNRTACPVFIREPGADDDEPAQRSAVIYRFDFRRARRRQMPTRYPIIMAT